MISFRDEDRAFIRATAVSLPDGYAKAIEVDNRGADFMRAVVSRADLATQVGILDALAQYIALNFPAFHDPAVLARLRELLDVVVKGVQDEVPGSYQKDVRAFLEDAAIERVRKTLQVLQNELLESKQTARPLPDPSSIQITPIGEIIVATIRKYNLDRGETPPPSAYTITPTYGSVGVVPLFAKPLRTSLGYFSV